MRKRQRQPVRRKIEVSRYKGRRGGIRRVLLSLAAAGCLCFALLFAAVMLGAHDQVEGDPQTMVVLGCQVKPWGPSILLQDRLDEALAYWQEHPDVTVVVSGGQGPDEPFTEAQAMAGYLLSQGVPEEQLLLEEESHNTIQNLRNAKQLLEEKGHTMEDGVVIVSNGFHLTRARMLAGRVGYENVSTLAAPSSHWPSRLKMYIREPLALVKSFVLDR